MKRKASRSRPRKGRARPVVSLGPSNDNIPPEEILAAEIGQSIDVWRRWCHCDRGIADDLIRLGVSGLLGLGAWTESAKHAEIRPDWNDNDRRDYWAGWLAAEMAVEGEPDDAWSWDVTRPIAGQYDPLPVERIGELLGDLPGQPPEGWEDKVDAGCDEVDEVVRGVTYSPPGSVQKIDELIERSSVGQGLKNIRENGIDAELAVLDEELRMLERKP